MAANNHTYEIDMCSGSILPKMLRFSLPLLCSGLLQLLFNAADIVVVGRFAGDNSMAAVGSTTSIINLMVNVFIGLSIGGNILAARYYGAKEQEKLRRTVHTAIALSIVCGIGLTVIGCLGAKQALIWMQSPPEVRDLATLYLRVYFLGMPVTLLYNFGAALLRAVGDTRRPLYYLLTAGVINVLLNLFFVIVCRMDVAGVALATVISQGISAVLVLRCMIRETGGVHLELRQLRIYPEYLKQILRIGLPAGFQSALFAFSNVIIQSSVNSFGEIMVAGAAASTNIEGFVYTSMNSVYQATVSFTSQNYGAQRYDRLLPILWRSMGCVIVIGLIFGGGALLLSPQLLSLYSNSEEVIAAGVSRMRIDCLPYFLCGLMEVMTGAIRGLGYSVMPMIVSLVGACGLRLVWIATIFQIPEYHTFEVIYVSYPITWIITLLTHSVCYIFVLRRLKRQLPEGMHF